jgi:GNAT superfamily N-acetyltransferase
VIRAAYPEDHGFILNSWLRSYSCSPSALAVTPHDGEKHTKACTACGAHSLRRHQVGGSTRFRAGELYWEAQKDLAQRLLARCNVAVWDSDGMLDGWVCREWQAPVLHYVYVRHSARRTGIARALVAELADGPAEYSHWRTGVFGARLPPSWRYNPYALTRAA